MSDRAQLPVPPLEPAALFSEVAAAAAAVDHYVLAQLNLSSGQNEPSN